MFMEILSIWNELYGFLTFFVFNRQKWIKSQLICHGHSGKINR